TSNPACLAMAARKSTTRCSPACGCFSGRKAGFTLGSAINSRNSSSVLLMQFHPPEGSLGRERADVEPKAPKPEEAHPSEPSGYCARGGAGPFQAAAMCEPSKGMDLAETDNCSADAAAWKV